MTRGLARARCLRVHSLFHAITATNDSRILMVAELLIQTLGYGRARLGLPHP
jgi:hypothetical protein